MGLFVPVGKSAHLGEKLTGWVLAQGSRSRYPVTVVMAGRSTCDATFSMHHRKSVYFTAILITGGTAVWVVRDSEYVLNRGDVALEQIGAPVALRSCNRAGFQQMFVRFQGPSVRGLVAQLGLFGLDYLRLPAEHPALNTVREIVQLGDTRFEYSDEILSATAYRLLALLAGANERGRLPQRLTRALHYIESNMDQQLGVGQLCRDIGVSRSSLVRLFRDHLGCSPHQYLVAQRIELSKSLIASGRLSLKEIAYTLGYTSPTYFSRQFARFTGMSPREFAEREVRARSEGDAGEATGRS